MTIQDSDWFTRQGGEGIAKQSKVIDSAFSEEVRSCAIPTTAQAIESRPG